MATIPGGNANAVSNDSVVLSVVDSILKLIGVTDSDVSTVVSGASFTGGSTFVQPPSASTVSTAILGTVSGLSSVTIGTSTLVINGDTAASGNKPVVQIEGSNVASTGAQLQAITQGIADKSLPDTQVGSQIRDAIGASVNNLAGSGIKNVLVTQVSNTDGRDTVSVTGGNNDVVVVSTGNSGTNLNVNANNAVIVGRSEQVTLSPTSGGSYAEFVSFTGRVQGSAGQDTIAAGGGSTATIVGGSGSDTFKLYNSWWVGTNNLVIALSDDSTGTLQAATATPVNIKSKITIGDFVAGVDKLVFDYNGVSNFAEFKAILASAKQIGSDVVATTRGGDVITLTGVQMSTLTEDMFTFV